MDKSFLGKGWSFPPTFSDNSNAPVHMVSNEEDIRQSLEILLNTTKGERVMLPDYGCDLLPYLFESISTSRMHMLSEMVKSAVLKYEPRVSVNEVIIDSSMYQEGIIKVKLDYTIESTNTRFNLVFPYYSVEGTHIPKLYSKQVSQKLTSVEEQ